MQYILKLDNNISLDNYIKDIAKGNMSALEMLYNNTRTIVFGYAFSILKNITEAEDVMQDVYLMYINMLFYILLKISHYLGL